MRKIFLILSLSSFLFTACNSGSDSSNLEDQMDSLKSESDSLSDGYELVWSDEFETNGLPDTNNWSYDVGGHGWGNNELQFYTKARTENARVENGKLIIEARKEKMEGNKYTSARLVSKGKADWTYGKFVIRAKVPKGKGVWAAIWMLPTQWDLGSGNWPDVGEIDIMEYVGHSQDTVLGTIHCAAFNGMLHTQKGKSIVVPNVEENFHDYILEWTDEKIEIFVDDKKFFEFPKSEKWEEWPFFRDFHLVLNIAIGGTLGKKVDDKIFPQKMEIEYIKVFQKQNGSLPECCKNKEAKSKEKCKEKCRDFK